MASLEIPTVPPSHLLKGSADDIILDPLGFLTKAHQQFGDSFRFRAGPKWFYIFTHPEQIRHVFTKNSEILGKEQNTALVLGESLLTTDGKKWDRQRKHSQPYFSKDHLNTLFANLHAAIENQTKDLASTEFLNVNEFSVSVIYEAVVQLLFKVENRLDFAGVAESIAEMTDFVRRRSGSLVKLPLWVPTPAHVQFNKTRQRFYNYIRTLNLQAGSEGQQNLLSFLSQDPHCDEVELQSEALTFFIAAFETTANALFWTFYLLLQNPEYMEKIFEEVKDRPLKSIQSFDDLKTLSYTRAVVMESMRLYPPAWFRSKKSMGDQVIAGYSIPKNAVVWVCTYLTHRHPALWNEPAKFRPERFLGDTILPLSYVPFGGGKTVCIGREMAIMELVVVLAYFFQQYKIVGPENLNIKPIASITLRPSQMLKVRIQRRPS